MTDYTKLIERLRDVDDQYCHTAAEAIEAMQDENERLRSCLSVRVVHQLQKERDALQAKLDEMTKQEPVATVNEAHGVNCYGYRAINAHAGSNSTLKHGDHLYAAPKALEPLRSALNAMLTQFGMDEDEFNKATFDKARLALADTNTVESLTEERINELALVRLVEAELKKVNV